jgi:DNA-binding MarR family transcriptional regulator
VSKDVTGEKSGKALPLSGKIGRIIQSLAGSPFDQVKPEPPEPSAIVFDFSEQDVARVLQMWRARSDYLPDALLFGPAWGMLLELLLGEIQGRRVSMLRLCNVSSVPTSTALRWIKSLENFGFVIRRTEPQNADDQFAELSRQGRSALQRYFRNVVLSQAPNEQQQ